MVPSANSREPYQRPRSGGTKGGASSLTSDPSGRLSGDGSVRPKGLAQLSGQGPLPADAAPLPLGQPAPDAELLAVREGELEAVLPHHAAPTDLLGLPGGRSPLGEEQIGVDAQAVGLVLPRPAGHGP